MEASDFGVQPLDLHLSVRKFDLNIAHLSLILQVLLSVLIQQLLKSCFLGLHNI